MEQPSSSSKVTVEYFDPHGVFQLLSPGLLPRLPLRNLHWESHAGPLRSISSLHVDLVPSIQSPPLFITSENASASTSGLSGVKSQESIASGDDGFRTQALGQAAIERPESSSGPPKLLTKERRHQIPGLRQTPYLKVFFLRCDDNDTYKAQARRQVREWIKENTPTTQSSSKVTAQENHDAYEWLIVHVIVPNTAAATQPRLSGKSGEGSSGSTSEKSTARWRGGGSSTILEKLRADFNGSSKSGVDRIAQIRIGINDVPYDMLPRVVPAIPGSYTETPQENENAWLDLIAKLKFQILTSFDMRVTQYEEDIREKDTQRLLPGWNFCTFFVLKEGLARGFESVGLIEDALVGYDELAVGLDMIVREQSITGSDAQHGGSFLPFTEDLKQKARKARRALLRDTGTEEDVESDDPIDMQSVSAASDPEWDEIPLNATRKRYRDLILSNDISIFDFRCYIFARQLALLLRLANASSSQEELLAKLKEQRESNLQGVAARNPASQPSEETENLTVLGEICRRSMDFMASISQIMRDDIWQSWKADDQTGEDGLSALPNPVMNQVINNMVSSFTFSISQQILAQTSTKALPIPPSTLASPSGAPGADGQEPKATIPEPKTMMHPARSSSLALRSRSREPPSPGIFPGMRGSSVPEQGTAASPFLKAGLEDLAGHRADLYLLSRSVLIQVGKEHKWSVGWEEVKHLGEGDNGEMEDVDLSQEISGNRETVALAPSLYGIVNKLLRTAIDDKDDFYRLYETLTDKALHHYTVANHIHSVQACMADLAVLKYHLGNVAAAASYFYRMTPFYGESGWAEVELSMLVVYASCLKKLSRKEEYVKVVLKLLSKTGLVERAKLYNKTILKIGRSSVHSETLPAESYIPELLEITKGLQHEVRIPLESFFGNIEVDGTLRHQPGKDSFEIEIRLQYLLMENLPIEKAKVRITSSTGDVGREIWLESSKPIVFKRGKNTLSVQSNVNVPGTYLVNHIILETNNIVMEYDHSTTGLSSPKDGRVLKCPKLLIYQRLEAFDIKLFASRYMHLDQNRSLEIALSSGWNQVQSGELHVRSATAGLRVVTSEAKIGNGSLELSKISEAGVVHFGAMEPYSNARIVMPFSLEHDVNDISLKLEISYTTEEGTFFFATTPSVSIMLPLGVNVQDFFKHKALFSKFTISSATSSPLRLLGSKLEDSEVFEAHSGLTLSKPLVIFPRQPATMLYKITKSPSGSVASKIARPSSRKGSKSVLSLVLNYICVEEEIEDAVTLSLENLLGKSSLIQYSRLIIPTFLTQVRMRLSPYDLEMSAVLGELHTSNLADIEWGDHFAGLGRSEEHNQEVSNLIEESLQQWIQQTPSIPLAPIFLTDDTLGKSRSIVIPVDVPSVSVVCTADLKFLELSSLSSDPILAASNQPLSATLTIKYTRIWNTAPEPEHDASTADDSLEFFYEVSAASDIWLIGGKRKGHFRIPRKASPEDSKRKITFPIVLIPLREGFIPFPHVDIKSTPRLHSSGENSGNPAKKVDVVSCETDYKNAGETVRVITDALNTTVSLDASGPQGGAWLLESERRGWESVEAVPSERQ